jgi:hypothetical protein
MLRWRSKLKAPVTRTWCRGWILVSRNGSGNAVPQAKTIRYPSTHSPSPEPADLEAPEDGVRIRAHHHRTPSRLAVEPGRRRLARESHQAMNRCDGRADSAFVRSSHRSLSATNSLAYSRPLRKPSDRALLAPIA